MTRAAACGVWALLGLVYSACGGGGSGPAAPGADAMPPQAAPMTPDAGAAAAAGAGAGAPTPGGPDSADAGAHDGAMAPLADPDPDAPFLDPQRLLEVRVELAEPDWEEIRGQQRSLLDIFAGDQCLDAPFDSPFSFARGSVTVDGQRVDDVGVRKKGFLGSLSARKPSLKLDFGQYVAGQTLSGMRRMTLNNNAQDEGHLNQCLGYRLFAAANVPAPRCNFARVFVNDEYLGVYSHVESVKKPFLRQHFDDDGGNLYEGTLSDFRRGWDGTFEQKTNATSDPSRADLRAVTSALQQPGRALVTLEPLVDLERFFSFWAIESLVGHGDGYSANANNFFVYARPGDGRFVFMPWGTDQLFDNGQERAGRPLPAVLTQGAVAAALYAEPEGRMRYAERMGELLDAFDADAELAELERMHDLVAEHIPAAQRDAFETSVGNLRAFLSARQAQVRAALGALPSAPAQPRDSVCFKAQGRVEGSFRTQWNSLDNDAVDPRAFSASFTPTGTTFTHLPNPLGLTTAVAGLDTGEDSTPAYEATILLILQQLDGSMLLVVVQSTPQSIAPGTRPIDFDATRGLVVRQVDGQEGTLVGILGEGTLTLEQAGTGDGAPIVGSFSATVYDPGFLLGGG